jgi:hypothetical protein
MVVALLALFPLAAAGCEKVNDVPRMQDEALEVAKSYRGRLDELAHRADAIRFDRLRTADAKLTYKEARIALDRARTELQRLALTIPDKAKAGTPEDLQRLIDTARERLELGVTDATSKLSAVESSLAMAEHPGDGRPPAPPPAPGNDEPQAGSPAPDR